MDKRNDLDGALRSTSLSRIIIVVVLSPQLLIPPHSVQAEASGGTMNHETSKGSPMKLYGLGASLSTQSKNSLKMLIAAFTSRFHNIRVQAVLRQSRTL